MYVIAYDIGTTGLKTSLFDISSNQPIRMIASAEAGYDLFVLDNGGVEQDPWQWWLAMSQTTKQLLQAKNISPELINGISFCAQMQAVVLVDEQGKPIRRAMSYMDNRGGEQIDKKLHQGVKVAGMNARILLESLRLTGAVSASVKDPVWKYRWVAENEPEVYKKIHKWLDVKDFLVGMCTGRYVMSQDSAFGTLLYDTRLGQKKFSDKLCHMLDVDMNHLPDIVLSTDIVGGLTLEAAKMLGLCPETPVFSGGGDASLIGIGAGAVELGDTHIYIGTSGWVITVIDKQKLDTSSMIASIVGADPGTFNCFAELDTAGKCFEWARKNLYGNTLSFDEIETRVADIPAGSHGIIFTPWLHGNRCPFEDEKARSVFFGIGIETCREDMYKAVIEGVCMHLRWQMEEMSKLVAPSHVVRLAGGGGKSHLVAQTLADIIGHPVEVIRDPQNAGSMGAAALMGIKLGEIESIQGIKSMIPIDGRYEPREENRSVYDKQFLIFKKLYKDNRKSFLSLGGRHE